MLAHSETLERKGHDIREANGTEKKRSGFEVTAATECVGRSRNEDESNFRQWFR